MDRYDTEKLSKDVNEALEEYTSLINSAVALQFLVPIVEYNAGLEAWAENLNKAKMKILGTKKIDPEKKISVKATPDRKELKKFAGDLYEKVCSYRGDSPDFVVETVEEGLSFIETLCKKHK